MDAPEENLAVKHYQKMLVYAEKRRFIEDRRSTIRIDSIKNVRKALKWPRKKIGVEEGDSRVLYLCYLQCLQIGS